MNTQVSLPSIQTLFAAINSQESNIHSTNTTNNTSNNKFNLNIPNVIISPITPPRNKTILNDNTINHSFIEFTNTLPSPSPSPLLSPKDVNNSIIIDNKKKKCNSSSSTGNFAGVSKRSNLPKETVEILNNWLLNHLNNPYPTQDEKNDLLIKTGLTKVQLSNWFINVRRRKVFSDYYTLIKNENSSSTNDKKVLKKNNNINDDKSFSLTRRKKLSDRLQELKKFSCIE